jgi:phenylacetate-CoA ligase
VDAASATPADLGALPVVTRGIVRDNVDDMLAMPKQRLDEAMTSGSSDAALTVYLDKDRSVREWAFVTHAWRAAGFRLGDRRAVMRGHLLRGAQSRYWSWEPGTRELRLSPLRLVPSIMDEYLDLIARFRVAFLHGYPSAITLLAAHARRVGWQPPTTLRGVLPISESLLPHQRAIIRDGFGPLPVVPFYGLTEKVAFACEVPDEPDVYEFEPLYGITEILGRDGRWVGTGQRGRLVGTGFLSTGMPLVRYFTGDLATVVRHPSAENCWRLRVTDLVSAKRQFYLVTAEGGLAPRTGLTHNDVARDYQFVQWEPGRAILRLVPEPGVTQRDLDVFVETVRVDSDGLLTYETEIVNEIPATSRGKRVFIEQHLDLAKYGLPDG